VRPESNGLTSDEIVTLRNLAHRLETEVEVLKSQRISDKEALSVANQVLTKWQATTNEWRATVEDLMNRFMQKKEAEALLDKESVQRAALGDRVNVLEKNKSQDTGKHMAVSTVAAIAATIASLLIAGAALLLRVFGK
jgi:hypothetical protein